MSEFLKKIKVHVPSLSSLGFFFLWLSVIGIILFLSFFIYLKATLPDPESIAARQIKESTKVYDKTGEILLYDIYEDEKRTIVPWEQIPAAVKNATLASEDNNFYQHKGFDYKGILRAIVKDLQELELSQGGSTITQQLVKNALLGQEKTFTRKLREVLLAIEIERRFTKDQILWMYLNQIPYGSTAYGIESAAQLYFNKPASGLTAAESATLAAMLRSPSYLSPYGSHVDQLLSRKDFILGRMKELNYLTEEEYAAAVAEKLVFGSNKQKLIAPHFVIMAKEYLVKKYGEDLVESGGLKITTTLDATLQAKAEELTSKYAKINKDRYRAGNAALVAIDPRNGEVLALVGSSDYFDTANEGNFNVATALRQPGSSFKPFAYAAAFQKGYPDSTVLFDLKTEFNPNCSPEATQLRDRYGSECYHPRNYDGLFRGPVTLRQSLQQSLNIPSVQTLYLAGLDTTLDFAERMGINSLSDRSRFGLAVVLGGAEVRLVDLVSAYGVFANDGIRNPWAFIKKVELANGTVLEEKTDIPSRVLDAQTARLMSDVLSDNAARATVFGANSPLYIPGRHVAAKTGTTQSNRDAWVVGYTPSIAVGVWTGNNNNSPMTQAGAGISASGPLWNEFMRTALVNTQPESFMQPNPSQTSKIMLNGDFQYYRDEGGLPEYHNILYYVERDNPLGPLPSNPGSDPFYRNWEWPVTNTYRPVPPPDTNPNPIPGTTPVSSPLPSAL